MKEILPVFHLKPLKHLFLRFFLVYLGIGLMCLLYISFYTHRQSFIYITKSILIFLITLPFMALFLLHIHCRQRLEKINKTEDLDIVIVKYTSFYKNRLMAYTISILISTLLFILTFKYIYPCIYLFQIVLVFSFYPSKWQLNRDLNGRYFIYL